MKYINIETIFENHENPRFIKDSKFERLCKSIQDFPEMLKLRPIIVDENNIVLAGNMRLKACRALNIKKIWVVEAVALSEAQKAEFIIKDNIGFGDWDWAVLANEWDETVLIDWGLDIPDFDNDPNNESIKDTLNLTFNFSEAEYFFIKGALRDVNPKSRIGFFGIA